MTKFFRNFNIAYSALLLILLFSHSASAVICPLGDQDGNCKIDLVDVQMLIGRWLDPACAVPDSDCAEDLIGEEAGVNLLDYAQLAANNDKTGAHVVISEYMADNENTIMDGLGEYSDWLELYNPSDATVDLGGCYLIDDNNQWLFPSGTILAGNSYLVVFASDKTEEENPLNYPFVDDLGYLHTNFKLGRTGEYLALVLPNGETVEYEYPDEYPQYDDWSYGLSLNLMSEGYFFPATPGMPNNSNPVADPTRNVVISEIMYHPFHEPDEGKTQPEPIQQEFIEIYNRGILPVNLADWRFSDGVEFTFPAKTLDPNQYLVVAANVSEFLQAHPSVDPNLVLGPWTGRLSNSGEDVDLDDENGLRMDSVHYYDQGEWAVRELAPLDDYSQRGWQWNDDHDGGGKTLELINPLISNNYGQNWAASLTDGGTPGGANSVASGNIPPMILEVKQKPIIPKDDESVQVTARIRDEITSGLTVKLYYREDESTYDQDTYPEFEPNTYTELTMHDDGLSGDRQAGDGTYVAEIPAQTEGAIIEFFVEASDGTNTRTWPAPADIDGAMEQVVNCLYQVYLTDPLFDPHDDWIPGSQPIYNIIMTNSERGRIKDIGSFEDEDGDSNAQMNVTFISVDGVDTKLRYNCGVRNRGHGTRNDPPNNFRVNFRHDESWKDVTAINLNDQYTYIQYFGHTLFTLAGLPSEDPLAVQLRINGVNDAADYPSLTRGSYVHLEAYDTEWADNHFGDDPDGNLYSAVSHSKTAKLEFLGWDPVLYNKPKDKYAKNTNSALNDWSDLINLTYILDVDETSDQDWLEQIEQKINRDQWLRWFAVCNLMTTSETNLGNGVGDDYFMYFGADDPRCLLLPHDLDSVLIRGSTGADIWLDGNIGDLPVIERFLEHPKYSGAYYAQFRDLFDTVFEPQNFDDHVERFLNWVDPSTRNSIKNFIASRQSSIITGGSPQIPQNTFAMQTNLSENPSGSGYYKTTSSSLAGSNLSGTANVYETRSVLVNGIEADWDHINGDWTLDAGIPLNPGINRVMVQTFDDLDGQGSELERDMIDIWYDTGAPATVVIDELNEVLDAASGPWYVNGNLTVPATYTLTIEPGTTVYFNQNARLTVQGRLVAEGTMYQRSRLTLEPDAGNTAWGGIFFDHTDEDNRLCYVDMEFAESLGEKIKVESSRVLLDNVTWTHTSKNVIEVHNPKMIVQNCVFPDHDNEEGIHGSGLTGDQYFIIRNNTFGWIKGYQDAIDFGGGDWPGPIIQIYDNVFLGGEDDGVDIDDADAHIEGNLFINFLGGSGTGTSNCIAADQGSKLTVVRNVFYNNQSAILIKGGAELVAADHNTFVGHSLSAVDFRESGDPGYGAAMAGNIFWNNAVDFADADQATTLTINRSILPVAWHSYGTENIDVNPHFVDPDNDDYHLRYFSPAVDTGSLGLDMGAYVPAGAALSLTTLANSATITVGGPGITDYQYVLGDPNGLWSSETSVSQPIQLNGLVNHQTYTLYAIGKNYAGVWQDHNEAASVTWTVSNNGVPLVINEILAINDTAVEHNGRFPDMIELYYDGAAPIFLDNMSITDDPEIPTKYIIPNGTMLDSTNRYLVLYADPNTVQPYHTGFALDGDGEAVYLYDSTGHLLDSVHFGSQIPDLTIGRVNKGPWRLTQPTLGQENLVQDVGVPETLKINEWLANGKVLFADDFIELYNPDPLPVDLSQMFITDNPISQPYKQTLGPLSYIAGEGYKAFDADDSDNPGHLDFQLNATKEMIALLDPERNMIDQVFYGPQTTDYSQGRNPDGGDIIAFFDLPTPDLPNTSSDTDPTTIELINIGENVKYFVPTDATDQDTWMQPGYNDDTWTSSTTPLGFGQVFSSGASASEWQAFNDCYTDQYDDPQANVTLYTIYSGSSDPTTGSLTNFATGSQDDMPTVTFTSIGSLPGSSGSGGAAGDPDPGTDAYDYFYDDLDDEIVDFSGNLIDMTNPAVQEITFSELNPNARYKFVGTAIRATSYPLRETLVTIYSHESATPNSSTGVTMPTPETARFFPADNRSTGYVVSWTDIAPGADGSFRITSEDAPGGDTKTYPINGFLLEQLSTEAGPLEQDMLGNNASCYTRIEFDLPENPQNLTSLTLKVRFDDAFVAFLNGTEVARHNFTGEPLWNSQADAPRDNSFAANFETYDISSFIEQLQQGNNILAIHALNENANDPNFLILPELTAVSDPNTDDAGYDNALALIHGLRITEMMYHPQDEPVGHPDAEFIELLNVGPEELNLAGVRFTNGIDYIFPTMTLSSGEYGVLVKDLTVFEAQYGTIPEVIGVYDGSLSNGGENIVLKLPAPFEAAIMRFEYNDTWYPTTDGGGYALVAADPYASAALWLDRDGWQAGSVIGGSPGTADP